MSVAAAFGCCVNVGSQFDNHGCPVNLMNDAVNGIYTVDEVIQIKDIDGQPFGDDFKINAQGIFSEVQRSYQYNRHVLPFCEDKVRINHMAVDEVGRFQNNSVFALHGKKYSVVFDFGDNCGISFSGYKAVTLKNLGSSYL